MSQQSELLRRLRQLSPARRDELLGRLDTASRDGGNRVAPLSHRQEQLWLFDRVAPSSAAYGLGFAITVAGPLDVPALRRAVDDVAERHTVLRSVFPHEHETGVQVVRPWQPVALDVEDRTGRDATGAAAEVVRDELRAGFDVNGDVMVRFRLLRLAADRHVLVVTSHHLVLDPRSADVLLDDLAAAYVRRAGDPGAGPADDAPPPQFGEFARWQRGWAQGPEAERAAEFWRRALGGWETTEPPADLPRTRLLDLTSRTAERALPAGAVAAVRGLAHGLGVPADDVLLAALFAVVSRHTSTRDLVIGVPHDITGPFDPKRLVGDCGNLLPLRVEVDPAASFEALVHAVHERRVEAERHGDLPFKVLLEQLRIEPDVGRLPLVQVGFGLCDRSAGALVAGGLRWRVDPVDTGVGRFELALEVDLDGPEPTAAVRYATALYRDGTADRFARRYLAALGAWTAAPGAPLSSVPLADADERRHVLEVWNAPIGEHRPDTVHGEFRQVADRHPDLVAVVSRAGTATYGELDARSDAVARRLVAEGVRPGGFVPVLVERGPDLVAAVLGVLKAGAAYVPIDLGQPAERVATVLEDCGARFAVASASAAPLLGAGLAVVDIASVPTGDPGGPPAVPVFPDSAAYVIYTSGSTGRPKGVVVEHRNVTNFVATVRRAFRLTPGDRVLQFASIGFDVSVFETFGALLTGARLYVTDENERRSVDALDRLLAEQRITVVDLPPAVMELLTPENYPDLRIAFVGGEAFSGRLTTRWARGREFYNGYGPTETTVTVVAKRCEGEWTASPPIGRAMDNHRAYLLSEDGELVPPGAVGEVAISGLGVARGYLGRPDLTAERFRPDPYGPPGSRLYLTGDLARWDDSGDLVFLGRADRQVKVRGIRIELGEVEAALQAVPGVARGIADAAVDPRMGSILVAYVVPEDGVRLQLDAVRAALGERLPTTMVPNVLVPLAEVPLTLSGKVDRRALPPVEFADVRHLADEDDDADSTPTERAVRAEVFAPLLGARIGGEVNFFAAGGTSLQAIRIASRVKAVFGIEVQIAEFFTTPTVRGLARLVDQAVEREHARRDALAAALELVEGRSDEEIGELAARLRSGG
ncbi:amino acid adenylation domain-containing protein [Saccharothrix sp. BKS2]|uniref:non-ribosomal peptide synthetase n=1 Tax=Saccharothrix sp. BKS2 TaxID=3064400 RepID=UPI0039EB258E